MTSTPEAGPMQLSVPRRLTAAAVAPSAAQRATLRQVADLLIPASGENPVATDAPDYDQWLDRCLAARADATSLLLDTLDQLAGLDDAALDSALRQLHAGDGEGRFHLLSSIVAGAYLAGDPIRALIGYPGQGREPARVDEAADELAEGILDPVLERGHIYVPTRDD
jgi:hypothetical protein